MGSELKTSQQEKQEKLGKGFRKGLGCGRKFFSWLPAAGVFHQGMYSNYQSSDKWLKMPQSRQRTPDLNATGLLGLPLFAIQLFNPPPLPVCF
jgi:hypothetical protein